MPWVGSEPTITASERTKTLHAFDRSDTVTAQRQFYRLLILEQSDEGVKLEQFAWFHYKLTKHGRCKSAVEALDLLPVLSWASARVLSSGMEQLVVRWKQADNSEKQVASVFRVEE
jgi:hypothetical protein